MAAFMTVCDPGDKVGLFSPFYENYNADAILTGAQLGLAVPDGDPVKLTVAAATLTALTGVLLIGASVLRLGFLANFISTPVLTGFTQGAAILIAISQLPSLLGFTPRSESRIDFSIALSWLAS